MVAVVRGNNSGSDRLTGNESDGGGVVIVFVVAVFSFLSSL